MKDDDDFQAVLAYQGALAFVYVADRTRCPAPHQRCAWDAPPRYEQDVLPIADAFFTNNRDGALSAGMKNVLDLVLTRRPQPVAEHDLPFEVYVGDGKTEPIDDYLKTHPHPTYESFASRLADLGVGPHGEHAGDVVLLAHNGDRERPEDRYYFASHYHSWHGSPSHRDSAVPLIVAHSQQSTAQLERLVRGVVGLVSRQAAIGELLVQLRLGKERKKRKKRNERNETGKEIIDVRASRAAPR